MAPPEPTLPMFTSVRTISVPISFVPRKEFNEKELDLDHAQRYIKENHSDLNKMYIINKSLPIPPGTQLYNSRHTQPLNTKDEEKERNDMARLGDAVKVEKNAKDRDSDKWLDRAMKRNTELLTLVERLRPLSNKRSFSSHIYQKYSRFSSAKELGRVDSTLNASSSSITSPTEGNVDQDAETNKKSVLDFSDRVSTTEIRDVLPRETLIQIIHEYLAAHKFTRTIETLNKESGVIYNGYSLEKMSKGAGNAMDANATTTTTILKTLLQMAVNNPEKPYALPTNDLENLEVDFEVQTASVYNHLEEEYAADLKRGFWDEILNTEESENIEYSNDGSIRAGSLNRLVEKITDYRNPDAIMHILKTFLTTYRSFTVPEVFLAKLTERYNVPDRPPSAEISQKDWDTTKMQIQIRTGNVLIQWIEDFFELDWNHQMIRVLTTFIEDDLFKHDKGKHLGKGILGRLDRKLRGTNLRDVAVNSSVFVQPNVPKNIFLPNLDFFDIDPIEIARQLTLREHEMYRAIEPSELLNQAWSKPKLKHRAPNIQACTDSFNQVSNWVATMILEGPTIKHRKERLIKFIKVAKALLEYNNFSSVLVITSGLQNAAVHRLNHSWGELDSRTTADYQECMTTMANDKSFKTYREKLMFASPPCVPYLGIFLTDLTFVEDGNPDLVKSKTGKMLINWKKKKMVHEVISNIKQYQYKPYDFQPVYQIQKLMDKLFSEHKQQTEEVLYKKSLELEPRGAARQSIL